MNMKSESGFASIVIAIIMVLVLSLMTIGFADLMRKETRSALDKQLSSQAFLAAESGVSDATKAINAGYGLEKKTCPTLPASDATPGADFLKNNKVSDDTVSSYTCLLINPTPNRLEYGAVSTEDSKAVLITGVDPAFPNDPNRSAPIGKLVISWKDAGGSNRGFVTDGQHNLKDAAGWSSLTGLLRIALTPVGSGLIGRDQFINNTSTMFLYPAAGAAAGSYSGYKQASIASFTGTNAGGFVDGGCNTGSKPLYCNVTINNLNAPSYLLDMRSVYNKTAVNVEAYTGAGVLLKVRNAQTVIDSTGKSQDVLRRIQVRVPSHTDYTHSDYSLQTAGDVCKQLKLYPSTSLGVSSNDCD